MVRVYDMSRDILLSEGSVAIVDDDWYPILSKIKWYGSRNQAGSVYAVGRIHSRHRYMHKIIAMAPDDAVVDHKNGNSLDNRSANLRWATSALNNRNRRSRPGEYKGAIYCPRKAGTKPWRARIQVNKKSMSLGYYKTRDEAALAYNAAAKRYFGEFATLNVISGAASDVSERSRKVG